MTAQAAPTAPSEPVTKTTFPFVARWAERGVDVPYSSTKIGDDDTGTYRSDTEEADT